MRSIMLKVVYYVVFSSFLLVLNTDANLDEKQLQEDIIKGYNRLVRPVERNSDQLVVRFGIRLVSILDVDEKNQILTTNVWLKHQWRDINLRWDPAKYNNLRSIVIPSSSIWIPDIILYNSANGKYEVTLMTRANVTYDGSVFWEPPAIFKSSCTINVEFFPFDVQHCNMKFGSWTYDGLQVDLVHTLQPINEKNEITSNRIQIGMDLYDFYQSHEWDIMDVPARRNIIRNAHSNEFYPDLTFDITLRRKTLFYTCNLIIPCVLLSFLTVLTFYLPSESGEKISLCISILLSLTVFVLLLNDLIPATSLVVPLIGKYLLFTIILVTLSILVTVVVLNVHFRSPSTHTMPKWARRIFLHVLPKVLLMKRPQRGASMSGTYYMKQVSKAFLLQNKIDDETQVVRETDTEKKNRQSLFLINQKYKDIEDTELKSRIDFRTLQEYYYYLDKTEAIKAVRTMINHLKEEDEEKRVREEWKYTALVIDRLFLVIFTAACVCGTVSIILQAPSFYDMKRPIDEQISHRFSRPS